MFNNNYTLNLLYLWLICCYKIRLIAFIIDGVFLKYSQLEYNNLKKKPYTVIYNHSV